MKTLCIIIREKRRSLFREASLHFFKKKALFFHKLKVHYATMAEIIHQSYFAVSSTRNGNDFLSALHNRSMPPTLNIEYAILFNTQLESSSCALPTCVNFNRECLDITSEKGSAKCWQYLEVKGGGQVFFLIFCARCLICLEWCIQVMSKLNKDQLAKPDAVSCSFFSFHFFSPFIKKMNSFVQM